jgi:hypothetical protein
MSTRESILRAITSLGHVINDTRVTIDHDPGKPGNALHQLADAIKPAFAAKPASPKPFGYFVYVPSEQRGEFVHDLDEATDDLTNCECEVWELYDHPATAAMSTTEPLIDLAGIRTGMATDWMSGPVAGLGQQLVQASDLPEIVRRSLSATADPIAIRDAAYQQGIDAMTHHLRETLDGRPVGFGSVPPELDEVARRLAATSAPAITRLTREQIDKMCPEGWASRSALVELASRIAEHYGIATSAPSEPAFYGFVHEDESRVEMCFTPSAPRAYGAYATAFYTSPQPAPAVPNEPWTSPLAGRYAKAVERVEAEAPAEPIDMVLHCPACGLQHIDAAERASEARPVLYGDAWTNPPHRSHLCHGCCHIWRPADVPTNGVAQIKTCGKNDNPLATPPAEVEERRELSDAEIEELRKATFSTENPFCPVDAKSMRKAARAVERFLAKSKEKAS